MWVSKKATLIICTAVLLIACEGLEDKVEGGWVIDRAYYNDEPVIWDLYTNGFDLREDNTCVLPISDWAPRDTHKETGSWEAFKGKGKSYIEISTPNTLFNRTFEVQNLRKVQDMVSRGYLMKMTLVADSLKMDCTKAM